MMHILHNLMTSVSHVLKLTLCIVNGEIYAISLLLELVIF